MTNYLLFVACLDLKWEEGSSAKVSLIDHETGREQAIGQTERVSGATPIYDRVLELQCQDPESDLIKVAIHDEHDQSRGVGTFTIANIMQHPKHLASLELSADRGTIVVHVAQNIVEGSLKLKLRAKDLTNLEGYTHLRKSDPFYTLSRPTSSSSSHGGKEWIKVYTSVVVMDNLDPDWPECDIDMSSLCDGNFGLPLKLEVWDQENDGKHDCMGSLITTVSDLLSMAPVESRILKNGDNNNTTGYIFVDSAATDGTTDTRKDTTIFMESVATALRAQSEAHAKSRAFETLKEDIAKANKTLEDAQAELNKRTKDVEEKEDEWSSAMAAAATALSTIGGL